MPHFEVQLTKKLHRVYDVFADAVIGRAPQCEIQLLSRAVSRRHARIELDGQRAIISDLGTKNGIRLNGRQVQGAALLGDGDQLVVGDIKMVYRDADRSVRAAQAVDLRQRAPTPADLEAAMGAGATFLLRAEPDCVNRFQATIGRGRIARLEFDDLTQFKLQIALREAIENARLHGCGGDAGRGLYVTFREDEDEFVMSVKDDGPGYDVDAVLGGATEVDALAAVRNRTPAQGPLGLRIILNCVDRLQFGERGATIHMGKVKAAGQLLVISEDGEEERNPFDRVPGAHLEDDSTEDGPLQLGDLF